MVTGTRLCLTWPRYWQQPAKRTLIADACSATLTIERTWMLSTSRVIDPRRFSPKIIRQRLLNLQGVLNALQKLTPESDTHFELDQAESDLHREVAFLRGVDLTYKSPYLRQIPAKIKRYVDELEDEILWSVKQDAYLSEDDLTEILQDKSTADFVLSEGGDEASAVKLWQKFKTLQAQTDDMQTWFAGLSEDFVINTEETLFHASLYAKYLARSGWSSDPGTRTGVGSLGKQQTISFTYSLVYAQQLYQFFIGAWLVANKKLSVDRAAALFISKRETYHTTMRKTGWLDSLLSEGKNPRDIYNKNDQGLNEFLNFVRMYNVSVSYLAIFNEKQLYEQLRKIPIDNIGIVKCLVNTDGAEHLPGEQELRVLPSAIKTTTLLTSGKH